jgi:hypothetical protein
MNPDALLASLLGLALVPVSILGGLGEYLFRHPRSAAYDFANPNPALVTLPVLMLGLGFRRRALLVLPIVIPSVLHWLWTVPLLSGESSLPARSIALFAALICLSVAWFIWQLQSKRRDRSWRRVLVVMGANVVAISIVGVLFAVASGGASTAFSLVAHWALFAWLAWCAFPWLMSST